MRVRGGQPLAMDPSAVEHHRPAGCAARL